MLEPKEITLTTQAGAEKTFILSKFPAVQGREIIAKYPLSNAPKLGDYAVSEETMMKLMAYVGVPVAAGNTLMLTTQALINNHAGDWLTLMKLEFHMLEYNCGFFGQGKNFGFLDNIGPKLRAWISPTLTDLLAQLLATAKPPSTS